MANFIKSKDARILFNIDTSTYEINDVKVAEFVLNDAKESLGDQTLYKKYNFDFGNCMFDGSWDTLENRLIHVIRWLFTNKFKSDEIKFKALFELGKIEEFYWARNMLRGSNFPKEAPKEFIKDLYEYYI